MENIHNLQAVVTTPYHYNTNSRDVSYRAPTGDASLQKLALGKNLNSTSLLLFVVGSLSTLDFTLIGRVTTAEVIVFIFSTYYFLAGTSFPKSRSYRRVFLIFVAIAAATIASDVLNETPILLSARAVAKPAFTAISTFFFVSVMSKDLTKIASFAYGAVLAGVVKYLRPSTFEDVTSISFNNYESVVFRIAPLIVAITVAVALFVYRRSRLMSAASFASGAATLVYFGAARSTIAIMVITSTLILARSIQGKSGYGRPTISATKVASVLAVLFFAIVGSYTAYVFAAPRGYLGNLQKEKFALQTNSQSATSPLSIILSSRPATYAAFLGVYDRPIIGFGSWRHDKTEKYVLQALNNPLVDPETARAIRNKSQLGFPVGAGHSVIMQSWVENGLVPAIGWTAILVITVSVLLHSYLAEVPVTPLLIYLSLSMTWVLCFSPAGTGLRIYTGILLAYYIVGMNNRRIALTSFKVAQPKVI